MPVVLQGHKFQFGVAKQSAEGTAATVAEFAIPAADLDFLPREERQYYESLDGNASNPGKFKSRADASGPVELFSVPGSLGRLVTAHMGSDTKTGASDPFLHTIVSNNVPQWLTVWINRPISGSSEWDKMTDVIIKPIDLQYNSGGLLTAKCDLLSKKATVKATAPTITTTETLNSTTPKHTWANPTLKLDLNATPAVTAMTNLQSFVIHFGYDDATMEQTDGLNPSYLDLGRWYASFSGDFLIDTWASYYATYFGSTAPSANTDQSIAVLAGAFDFLINTDPLNANRTLQIQETAVEFELSPPKPDRSGKGLRATLSGNLALPSTPTVLIKNAVSTAY